LASVCALVLGISAIPASQAAPTVKPPKQASLVQMQRLADETRKKIDRHDQFKIVWLSTPGEFTERGCNAYVYGCAPWTPGGLYTTIYLSSHYLSFEPDLIPFVTIHEIGHLLQWRMNDASGGNITAMLDLVALDFGVRNAVGERLSDRIAYYIVGAPPKGSPYGEIILTPQTKQWAQCMLDLNWVYCPR
jgi:hypothetical protein